VKIAVVIPALNEAGSIAGAIESAAAPDIEVVVVDGGSADETRARALASGARVVESEPGRGRQLRAGAAATTGDAVVFLHADSRLPKGWRRAVEGVLEGSGASGTVGGAFRLRFDASGLALSLVEWGARLRVMLFDLPYGDQAIFVRRRVLEAIGGVPDVEWMEDLDLVTAMKTQGGLVHLDLPALTSARRYKENGVLRTVGRHALAAAAWRFGIDRTRVASWLRE
jgi:rSAM/selenodomain-associated transferase 2